MFEINGIKIRAELWANSLFCGHFTLAKFLIQGESGFQNIFGTNASLMNNRDVLKLISYFMLQRR